MSREHFLLLTLLIYYTILERWGHSATRSPEHVTTPPHIYIRFLNYILYTQNIFYRVITFYPCRQSILYYDCSAYVIDIGVDVSHYLCSRIPPERDSRE